jgi:hypothetical protein
VQIERRRRRKHLTTPAVLSPAEDAEMMKKALKARRMNILLQDMSMKAGRTIISKV